MFSCLRWSQYRFGTANDDDDKKALPAGPSCPPAKGAIGTAGTEIQVRIRIGGNHEILCIRASCGVSNDHASVHKHRGGTDVRNPGLGPGRTSVDSGLGERLAD